MIIYHSYWGEDAHDLSYILETEYILKMPRRVLRTSVVERKYVFKINFIYLLQYCQRAGDVVRNLHQN